MLNFPSSPVRGRSYMSRRGVIESTSTSMRVDVACRELVATREIEHHVERRMSRGAGGIQLHGDPGRQDLPVRAQPRGALVEREMLGVHRGEKSLRALERPLARRVAALRKERGHEAVARRHACVQRLHHAPHVFLETAGRRRRDAERMVHGERAQAEECARPRRRHRRSRSWTCSASRGRGSGAGSSPRRAGIRFRIRRRTRRAAPCPVRARARRRPAPPARARSSDAPSTRSTCRRNRARAPQLRWRTLPRVALVVSAAPMMRHGPRPSCRAIARTCCAAGSSAPASVTPTVSQTAAAARSSAAAGTAPHATNSAIATVALPIFLPPAPDPAPLPPVPCPCPCLDQ